jgi:hypothetical protein
MAFVRVTGKRDGHAVWATWEDGRIYGDPRLVELAQAHVERHEDVALTEAGPYLTPRLDNPWSFAATMASLVDDPAVSGDDLPSARARHSQD